METLSTTSRDTDTGTAEWSAFRKQPARQTDVASLRRAGLHRLTFSPLPLCEIAEKMGYRKIAQAVLSPENRQLVRRVGEGMEKLMEAIRQQYPHFDFTLYADRLELTHEYPIHLFYFIEVPYQIIQKSYPTLTHFLVCFLHFSQRIGLSVWDEHYYTGTAIDSLDEQIQEGEWDEEDAEPVVAMIEDARALSQAIEKCSMKRTRTLKRHLQAFQPKPAEQELSQVLLKWIDLLEEPNTLANYDGIYVEPDSGEEVLPPSVRFVISPEVEPSLEEMINYVIQEAYMPELTATLTLTSYREGLAISLFPLRICHMITDINEAIERLKQRIAAQRGDAHTISHD